MTSPTYLPASLARTQVPVGECPKVRSGVSVSFGFGGICYLAFFSILVGSSLFAHALPEPQDQLAERKNNKRISVDEPVVSAVVNHEVATGTIQPPDHRKQLSEAHNNVHSPYPSLHRNVSQSYQLDPPLVVIDLSELFAQDGMRNLGLTSSAQQSRLFRLSGTPPSVLCQGRCLDPHPGPFRFWNGQQNGCWVQVWRSWQEGCQHYQWYNSCNGYWDSYPNGAPRVFWNCCVH